jgi:LEA14-like dessication related protein
MNNNCGRIHNIEEYIDFLDEVVKGFSYPVYMNGKKVNKQKITSEAAIEDAEDWFDNNVTITYSINNKHISILIG